MLKSLSNYSWDMAAGQQVLAITVNKPCNQPLKMQHTE